MNKLTEPLVSICILTYNHEKFLENCLDSILSQKVNFKIELIVHDDASTDSTAKILRRYDKLNPGIFNLKIQIENQRQQSPFGGMNPKYNYPRAKGTYIALCEGDDYWESPNKLQKQIDFLESNLSFAGCYHDTLVEYEDSEKEQHLFRKSLPRIVTAEDTISTVSPFHTSSFLFRKSALQIHELMFKVKSGDMALFSIVSKSGHLGKVEGLYSVYRKHGKGITNSGLIKDTYHKDRISLINLLNAFHNNTFKRKAQKVILYHENNIKGITYVPKRDSIITRIKKKFR